MANSLDIDLIEKDVLISKEYMQEDFQDLSKRVFHVEGGFGASSFTGGTMLGGYFLFEGENGHDSLRGWMVDRLATEEEVKNAKKLQPKK